MNITIRPRTAPPKLLPAALGGLFIGVLSALPFVNAANCCCLWIVAGGYLAAFVMQQNHPASLSTGDGVIAGLLAGIFGAVVFTVVSIPIDMVMGPLQARFVLRVLGTSSELPPAVRDVLENMAGSRSPTVVATLFDFIPMLIVSMIFAPIGGLLGVLFSGRQPSDGPTSSPPAPPLPPAGPTPSSDPWPPPE